MKIIVRGAIIAILLSVAPLAHSALAAESAVSTVPMEPRDLAKEKANEALVLSFYDAVFNQHDLTTTQSVLAENYIQHNPRVPDGRTPFFTFFASRFRQYPQSHNAIDQVGTAGDLVFLHVHATNDSKDRGTAIVDIFRVADDKIVEHWDVVQPVPETSINSNTMF